MREHLKSAGIFAVGLCIAVAATLGSSHAQQPLKLRMAWTVAPAQLAPIMLDPPGVAKHAGKSYVLEPVRYQGSAATMAALAANELDLAPLTFIQLGPAIQNAGLTDLRIIADEIRDGVDDYATNEYLVLKDGPIRKVEDMKGKVFATNGIGGGQDVFARVMFRKHGLETPRDYTTVEAAFPNMRAFLAEKKADLVVGVKPFTEDPGFRNISHTLFTQKEAVGQTDMVFINARAPFIAKNRAALVDFFEDYIRVTRWYMDPANQQAAVAIVAKFTNVPPERLGWIFTKRDFYRDSNGAPDLVAIQRSVDLLKEFNFLKEPLEVKKYADLSLIEDAAKRLK